MKKVLGLISLAKKAGRVVSGESACKEAIRFGSSHLIILTEDASTNTKKNITDSCIYYDVPYVIAFNKDTLGHSIGNAFNAVVSINDEGLATGILNRFQTNN